MTPGKKLQHGKNKNLHNKTKPVMVESVMKKYDTQILINGKVSEIFIRHNDYQKLLYYGDNYHNNSVKIDQVFS